MVSTGQPKQPCVSRETYAAASSVLPFFGVSYGSPANTAAAAALLETNGAAIGLGQIFYGPSLETMFNAPGLPPSGDPRTPWLEPDIGAVLQKLAADGARDVVVSPIGFVCDHIEVLYDLDTEARKIALQNNLNMVRAATVN